MSFMAISPRWQKPSVLHSAAVALYFQPIDGNWDLQTVIKALAFMQV